MTIVVIIAARKTKPPKAARAMIAPRFNLAENGWRLLSTPSTLRGMFTLGASLCLTLTLLSPISFSCGCPATMMCGGGGGGLGGAILLLPRVLTGCCCCLILLRMSDSVRARTVVGPGRVGRGLPRVVGLALEERGGVTSGVVEDSGRQVGAGESYCPFGRHWISAEPERR